MQDSTISDTVPDENGAGWHVLKALLFSSGDLGKHKWGCEQVTLNISWAQKEEDYGNKQNHFARGGNAVAL